jgi:hypothetical protein
MADVRAYIERLQRLAAQPRAAGPPARSGQTRAGKNRLFQMGPVPSAR